MAYSKRDPLTGRFVKKGITHCKSCGEWLEGFDQCSECGMIQK